MVVEEIFIHFRGFHRAEHSDELLSDDVQHTGLQLIKGRLFLLAAHHLSGEHPVFTVDAVGRVLLRLVLGSTVLLVLTLTLFFVVFVIVLGRLVVSVVLVVLVIGRVVAIVLSRGGKSGLVGGWWGRVLSWQRVATELKELDAARVQLGVARGHDVSALQRLCRDK